MQPFPKKPNITTDFTRPPFIKQHFTVIVPWWSPLHGSYFTTPIELSTYKAQRLGTGTLRLFMCGFGADIVIGDITVLQCENKFIASFPLGFGKGVG